MKVFLSWSGKRSRAVATALREWLPNVVNALQPWMSEEDIAAGARWSLEIAGSLKEAGFGVVCVTPENWERPWLLFEAGALAKAFDSARVAPYLFGFKDKSLPGSPLSQLQAKLANKEDSFDLVKALNDTLGDRKLDTKRLEAAYAKWWPDLEAELTKIKPDDGKASPQPSVDDRLAELLALARAQKAEIEAVHEVVRSPQTSRAHSRSDGFAELLREQTRLAGGSRLEPTIGLLGADRRHVEASFPRTKDELIEYMDRDARGDDEDEPEDDGEQD
ncbi:MAG: toll/interleukin-1 receptor domain-containing protein [Labilithrix sp.]|nr:toll/interleukin-1 receptor domain-containing protein [Labilithrix sp.]